jgi:hypothetical protein
MSHFKRLNSHNHDNEYEVVYIHEEVHVPIGTSSVGHMVSAY